MPKINEATAIAAVQFAEQSSAPATPISGQGVIYFKSDGKAYSKNDAGTESELGVGAASVLHEILPGGRLTLTSGTAVTTTDVTGAGTLYYTPYRHNVVYLYDGSAWVRHTFTERSLSLTLTSGKNYDAFLYNNSGTLTLELSAAWTNDTTRADALTTQDGITVKSGATTRLWLGTIRASGSNTTEDSGLPAAGTPPKRYVWNTYNRVLRPMRYLESTTAWTYASSIFRSSNAGSTNRLQFVVGEAAGYDATFHQSADNSGRIAIAADGARNSFDGPIYGYHGFVRRQGLVTAGYHYLETQESANGTLTFYGSNPNWPSSGTWAYFLFEGSIWA